MFCYRALLFYRYLAEFSLIAILKRHILNIRITNENSFRIALNYVVS